jgi:hypothetical protein
MLVPPCTDTCKEPCISDADAFLNLDNSVGHTEPESFVDHHCFSTNINCPSTTNTLSDQSSDDEIEEDDATYDGPE